MSTHLGAAASRLTRFLFIGATVFAMMATATLNNVAHAQDVTPTVMLMQHPTYGLILTDSSGFTLYTWEADEPEMSNCYDQCADIWPPLIATDQLVIPTGLPGALDLIDRGDGTWQVALDGWPLYYFARDMQPGDVNGDGNMGFGARWDVVALSPAPIAEEPITAPPVAEQPVPVAPVAQPPAPVISQPPAAAIPAQPGPTDMTPPMGMPPGMEMGNLPPGLPPIPGQATIPPGYLPTLSVVAPPNGVVPLNWLPTQGAQSYRIYQTPSSQPTNFSVSQTVTQAPGQIITNGLVSGLLPGGSYLIQVRAVDPNGNEIPAPATAMLGPAPNAGIPGPGLPSSLTVTGTTPTTITFTWIPIPGARSYVVLQATNPSGPFIPANMAQVSPNGATVTGLTANTMYYFQLFSVDAFGNQTPASGAISLTTAPLAATSTMSVIVNNVTANTAMLQWAAMPGAASYQILQSLTPAGPWTPAAMLNQSANGGMVTGLMAGSTYYFQVVALDMMGNQIGSALPASTVTASNGAPVLATTLLAPSGVTSASTTGSTVTLTWTPTAGATGYAVLQSQNNAGPFVPAVISNLSGTTATITGLNPNSMYFFQVVAFDQMGHQSAPSGVITAQTSSSIATMR